MMRNYILLQLFIKNCNRRNLFAGSRSYYVLKLLLVCV